MIYQAVNTLIIKKTMLRSDSCDYSHGYIVVKGTRDLLAAATNENDKAGKSVAFKDNAPFRSCISKINSTLIDNEEYLDRVMPMYNLLEYSQVILWEQEVYGVIIKTKLIILTILLKMVNYLNIKEIVGKTPAWSGMKEIKIDKQYQL